MNPKDFAPRHSGSATPLTPQPPSTPAPVPGEGAVLWAGAGGDRKARAGPPGAGPFAMASMQAVGFANSNTGLQVGQRGAGTLADIDRLIERFVCEPGDDGQPPSARAATARLDVLLRWMTGPGLYHVIDRFINSAAGARLGLDALERIALVTDALRGTGAPGTKLYTLATAISEPQVPERFAKLFHLVDHLLQVEPGQSDTVAGPKRLKLAQALVAATGAMHPEVGQAIGCRIGKRLGLGIGTPEQLRQQLAGLPVLRANLRGDAIAPKGELTHCALMQGLRLSIDPASALDLASSLDEQALALQVACENLAEDGERWELRAGACLDSAPRTRYAAATLKDLRQRVLALAAAQREGGASVDHSALG